MVEKLENLFLINAPAGSGKTTKIKEMINEISKENKNNNILCITYTNRAVKELTEDINLDNVDISTIHSFLNSFMSVYFGKNEIIELFFDTYENEIEDRILNKEGKENYSKMNERYKEKFGDLNKEVIRKNIEKIQYNELPFNSLYYGGLGHDDLLSFSKRIVEKFKKIQTRLVQKYQYIFVDEYQDTSTDVLDFFYNSVLNSNTQLFLLGDKMQEIYKNYDGTFEEKLEKFKTHIKLEYNYRSTSEIISVLNGIYNNRELVQKPKEANQNENKVPEVIFSNNLEDSIANISEKNDEILKLYIHNRKRFNAIDAENLYHEVNKLKRYSFGSKHSAVDVLTDSSIENPDPLMKLLFILNEMIKNYRDRKYGVVINEIKNREMFNKKLLLINYHYDKKNLSYILAKILAEFNKSISIGEFLQFLDRIDFLACESIIDFYGLENYDDVLSISLKEFRNLVNYLKTYDVSTQHGVKGEGYNKVLFIAENSSNPSVKIYDFFKLWANYDVNFIDFQRTYYRLNISFKNLEDKIGAKISEWKNPIYKANRAIIEGFIEKVIKDYNDNLYFRETLLIGFEKYMKSPGVTNAKNALKLNKLYGVLSAYKLFYVGCSRAKEELIVLIDKNKLKCDEASLKRKLINVGFNVQLE